jgi:heme exporter protein C
LAYFVLRSSFDDADKKARISAVYNIFAFAALIPLLYIIPRMVNSLHPGAEGNPAFSSYDLDSNMRLIFYPAVIGWILMGVWIATIWIRIEKIWQKKMELL